MPRNPENPNRGRDSLKGTSLTSRARGLILKAFDCVEAKPGSKLLSEYLAEAFMDNPLKFMDTASKYIIKDANVDIETYRDASRMTDDELATVIATRARARLEAAQAGDEKSADVTHRRQTG